MASSCQEGACMGVADAGFQADSRIGVAMPCMGVMSPRAG